MYCSICHPWVRSMCSLKMTYSHYTLKQMFSRYYCVYTHTLRSPVPINHVDADEWKRDEENTSASWSVFTNLLSRQQIHSADGDELGDIRTATIFFWPCVMLLDVASRLSVVVNECELRLRSLPSAPPLRAASHYYRLLMPSSWHADDLCQSALMGFFFFFFWEATGGSTNNGITHSVVL